MFSLANSGGLGAYAYDILWRILFFEQFVSFWRGYRMQAYRQETILEHDGTLTLRDLPLQAGEKVEVIINVQSPPVAASGWEASK